MGDLRKILVGVVIVATVAGCTSSAPTSSTVTSVTAGDTIDTDASLPVPPPPLAAPPPPMVLQGTPHEQAVQLADGFERDDELRAAVLLAAFGAAGLAVVDETEHSLTTPAETVGVSWVFVYNSSTAPSPTARISLAEVARIFAADGIMPALDVAAVGGDLVNGLRAALAGDASRPGPPMIALLVQEEARRARGVDLADPAVTADQISVSIPTATLLVSAGVLAATGRHNVSTAPAPAGFASTRVFTEALPPGCATDSDGQWALWLVSKLSAGADLPGFEWEGLFGTVITHLESFYPEGSPPGLAQLKAGFGKLSSIAGFAAAALTALSAIVANLTYSARVTLKPNPLIRTKSSRADGGAGTIVAVVGFDFGKLDPRRLDAVNCLLSALSVLGNNSTVPVSGPAKGVAVTIDGLEGFGDRLITEGSFVLLNTPLTKDTDDAGMVEFSVVGRHQRVDIPETAAPFDRFFSVAIEGQADPTDVETLTKLFLDSFLCAGAALNGKLITACVDPIADIWRQTKWDLGTWQFRLVDWAQDYRVDGEHSGLRFQATKCDGIAGTWDFTVTTASGRYVATGPLTVVVDRDPVPGGPPVQIKSDLLDFRDASIGAAYQESFFFEFFGDGADTTFGAPAGAPAVAIDEDFGGAAFTMQVGNFC